MTAESAAATETVTIEMSVESAYRQLVGFQQAVKEYSEADETDSAEGRLSAANSAVDACLEFINELMPRDLSDSLHERLEKEHPELVPEEDPMLAIIRQLLGEA